MDKRAHKSLRKLLRELQRQGFRYELSGRLHWKVFGCDGMMVATLPGTPLGQEVDEELHERTASRRVRRLRVPTLLTGARTVRKNNLL